MNISLRSKPYPFSAAISICSDLDETPDARTYFETMRFLNTKSDTAIGTGVGLEVGNTIYFFMPKEQFSYVNASFEDRKNIHNCIKSGHIDCLHSFGDLATSREDVEWAWAELNSNSSKIEVWIDHAEAMSNFDSQIMFGQGANIGSKCYHADLTLRNGVKFIWKGRVTSLVSQESVCSFLNVFNRKEVISSLRTMAKELTKIVLGYFGHEKYAMHASKSILRKTTLSSGHNIIEFMRSNPSWGGVSHNETADGIADILTDKMLNHLVTNGSSTIIYTHLGKTQSGQIFPESSVAAFRRLARYSENGSILVTTTRRLLGYQFALENLKWKGENRNGNILVVAEWNDALEDLQGLTWNIPDDATSFRLIVNGDDVCAELNPADHTGTRSASVPWHKLSFPCEL